MPPRASSTTRWTPSSSCPTPRASTASCSRRASPKRAPWPASPPPAPAYATPPVCPWCRSSSSIRCSASSGWATSFWAAADAQAKGFMHGRHRRAHHPAGRGACSTRTGRAWCWPRRYPRCQAYDPAFAYEMARHHRARPARACTAGTDGTLGSHRGRRVGLLLPDRCTTRTTRCPSGPRMMSVTDDIIERLVPVVAPAPEGLGALGHHPLLGLLPPGRPPGPGQPWPSSTASVSSCGAATSYKAAPRGRPQHVERWNRLHPLTRSPAGGHR